MGRLSFYCQDVGEKERPQIYKAVDEVLDAVAGELDGLLARKAEDIELLSALAGTSIAERLKRLESKG